MSKTLSQLLRPLLVSAAVSGALHADLSLSWVDGVMGSELQLRLAGDSSESFLLIPSFQDGPLPLSILDPGDPRVLSVGIDLSNAWTFGVLGVDGKAGLQFGVPLAAGFVGLDFHAQALTLPGALFTVDDVSNPIQFALAPPGTTLPALGELSIARRFPALATLNDGRVLVVGGQTPTTTPSVLGSWEIYDPQAQSFTFGSAVPGLARSHAEAVTLDDGRVLVVGGVGPNDVALSSCVIFDPDRGTFGPAAPMGAGRVLFGIVRLPGGRVLVVGGSSAFDKEHPFGYPSSVSSALRATSEIYDPTADAWQPGPQLTKPLSAPACVPIVSGLGTPLVLITGGIAVSTLGTVESSAEAFVYNPSTGAITQVGDQPDSSFHGGTVPTASGDAIIAGGTNVDFSALTTDVLDSTWIFRGSSLTWGVGPDVPEGVRCGLMVCIRRPNGTYVYPMTGGLLALDLVTGQLVPNDRIYSLDGSLSSWSTSGTLTRERVGVRIAAVDDGLRILVVGSETQPTGTPVDRSADVYVVE